MRVLPLLFLLATPMLAQHEHHAMHDMQMSPAKLEVNNDPVKHVLVVTLGPLDLPAHTDHRSMPQPAPQILEIPFDGWITAYHPSLMDARGAQLPPGILHHVAFWNTARADFLCPNKDEHIFGAGGEMNDWPALPGFGYRVRKGDRIRITTMFHNPTATSYANARLSVAMEYQPAEADAQLKSVYPAWFDVKQCGNSEFQLAAEGMKLDATIPVHYSGRLLGVGGHLHDYGRQLLIRDATQNQLIAELNSTLDEQGHIRAMPIVTFADRGGFPLRQGDNVEVAATYDKPRIANADGMGIVVGYFLPNSDADMQPLARH
ncbi:MAG: hypothetical protein ACR2IF_16060 [Terriglobales bacterium]